MPGAEFRVSRNIIAPVIAMTDQNGTVHEYDYDGLGRRTADRVVTVGTGIDDAVRRLETVYDDRQQVESQTSYDAPTGGTALNQVAYTYNALGLPHQETQTAGAASGTVQYFYSDPATNTLRKSLVVYPSGRGIRYRYDSADPSTDILSQITKIVDDNVATKKAFARALTCPPSPRESDITNSMLV